MNSYKAQEHSAPGEILRAPTLPLVIIVAAAAIGLAALLPLVQSSGATSTNGRIQQMEQQKTDLQAQIRTLEIEVARMGSLDRVEAEARQRLRMETPQEVHYLPIEAPGPEGRKLPSRFLPPTNNGPTRSSPSFVEKLLWWLPLP